MVMKRRRPMTPWCRLVAGPLLSVLLLAGCHQAGPPTGDWSLARSGAWAGRTWQLFVTPAHDGGRCLALETTPPLSGGEALPASELYKGHLANCLLQPGLGPSKYANIIDNVESPDGTHALLGQTAAGVRSVRVLFNGSYQTVDTGDGYFVLFYRTPDGPIAFEPMNAGGVIEKHCPTQPTNAGLRTRC